MYHQLITVIQTIQLIYDTKRSPPNEFNTAYCTRDEKTINNLYGNFMRIVPQITTLQELYLSQLRDDLLKAIRRHYHCENLDFFSLHIRT